MADNDKPISSVHLPLALIYVFGAGLVAVTVWLNTPLTELRGDIRTLTEWREQIEQTRFNSSDALALETQLIGLIRDERTYSRQICNELRRLQIELEVVPVNDCARP